MANELARARTVTLLGSVLTALSSGTTYVYSAYAPQLGTRLRITHTQLNIIGSCGNMGAYTTGPFVGRIVDKRGPRPLLLAALILLPGGYTGIRSYYDAGAPADQKLPLFHLMTLSLFSYMTGVGGKCGFQASVTTTAKIFPEHMRGTTVGFVISGFGLSAFFFSTLAHWFFSGNTSSFLLFLSLGTALPFIIGFLTVRPIPHAERPNVGPDGLAIPGPNKLDSSTNLLAHGSAQTSINNSSSPERLNGLHRADEEDPCEPQLRRPSMEDSPARSSILGRYCVDIHGKRMLLGWEFWLLFTILSLLSGTGLMCPFSERKSEAEKLQAAQVSIISLANCAARIGFGAGADFAKSRFSAHRSYLLSVISTLFIISQIVGSQVENVNHLWQASVLLGLGYGGLFGLLPTITIDWFGLAHFSENWGFVGFAPLLGGGLFSILFGRNLDRHAPTHTKSALMPASTATFASMTSSFALHVPVSDTESGRQCLQGRICYSEAMGVTTAACALALLLSLVAAWRDWQKMENKYESVAQEVIGEDDGEA